MQSGSSKGCASAVASHALGSSDAVFPVSCGAEGSSDRGTALPGASWWPPVPAFLGRLNWPHLIGREDVSVEAASSWLSASVPTVPTDTAPKSVGRCAAFSQLCEVRNACGEKAAQRSIGDLTGARALPGRSQISSATREGEGTTDMAAFAHGRTRCMYLGAKPRDTNPDGLLTPFAFRSAELLPP